MFFKVLLSFETVFHAQSRQNIKFLAEEGNKCKRHFSHLFHLYHGLIVYIIIAYKQKSRWENKYYLKTFQIDPLLMFLFLCVKDNLFSNFPFQLNAMFVHGNCHYRMPVNFEGHNFVYKQFITTNYIRRRKLI